MNNEVYVVQDEDEQILCCFSSVSKAEKYFEYYGNYKKVKDGLYEISVNHGNRGFNITFTLCKLKVDEKLKELNG